MVTANPEFTSSEQIAPAQRYALVLIDISRGFTDAQNSPLGTSCDSVVAANQQLLDWFRQPAVKAAGWPVFFTTVSYQHDDQARVFREKLPSLNVLQQGSEWVEIDPRVAPAADEVVITKHWASGFFATDLAAQIKQAGCDGIVVTGLTTSGCVRATAVDGLQHGFRVLVPREAVGDRDSAAHDANLKDLQTKYADVISLQQTLDLLNATHVRT